MRLFVTGATGFVGSHVINTALSAGQEVVGLKRAIDRQPRIKLCKQPTWIVKSYAEVEHDDFENIDCLIHLAAHSANVPYDTLEACLLANVIEPLRLFRQAVSAGVKRFLVAGTGFEYGRSASRYAQIPTTARLEPTLSYPASKAAATVALSAFAAETQTQFLIARLFQVFGPGESDTRFWPSLHRAAIAGDDFPMSAGDQVRDFTPVEFVAEQLVRFAETGFATNREFEIRHVASGHPQSLREFAEHWWTKWNATGKLQIGAVPMRDGEMMRYVPEVE